MGDELTVSQVSAATSTAGWHDPAVELSDAPAASERVELERAVSRSRLDEGKLAWMLRRFPTPEGMDPGAWEAILKHTISPRRWIDDATRAECTGCGCAFAAASWSSTLMLGGSGKHHCRICGDVFCGTCAPVREAIPLPGFITVIDEPEGLAAGVIASTGRDAVGALAAAVGYAERGSGGYRRCKSCERLCVELDGQKGHTVQESLEWLKHRQLQNKLPYHSLSIKEEEYVRTLFSDPRRMGIFQGHSKWLVQLLLKGVRWDDPAEAARAASLVRAPREPGSCGRYCCTRGCRERLQPEDIVVLLAHLGPDAGPSLREPLIAVLDTVCSEATLLCYIPTLVTNLHSSFWVGTHINAALGLANTSLARWLTKRAARSPAVHTKLHWQLQVVCDACEATAARLRISKAQNSQAAENQRLEAAAASARGSGCRALQHQMLLAADDTAVHELIQGQNLHAALKLVDSVHASADQFADGATLKKQLKDAARAVFPAALAAASSDEQTAEARAAAATIATPRLPVLPEWGCVRIDHHSAKRMGSKTRPFMVSCDCVRMCSPGGSISEKPSRASDELAGETALRSVTGAGQGAAAGAQEPEPEPDPQPPMRSVRLMVKQNDDLRKDQIVLDSIELMCTILKSEMPSLSLPLVRYKVLPTAVDSGMVEVVGESTTLYAIEQRVGYSIAQYLIDHNGADIEAAQHRFVESLACYIIFTYILGVGDRHLENVMLRQDGCLFHIDFGFILGEEPTKAIREGSEFRLCTSQIAAMGGPDHPNYHKFTQLCEKIFLCLRRHAAVFYTCLKDTDVSLSTVEIQRHFDLRCGYRSFSSSATSRGRSSPTAARTTGTSLASVPEAGGGGERSSSGATAPVQTSTICSRGVGVRTDGKSGARYGESARILDDEQARQMLRRALKSAEAAGNYYKINDMVHTLAKERSCESTGTTRMTFVDREISPIPPLPEAFTVCPCSLCHNNCHIFINCVSSCATLLCRTCLPRIIYLTVSGSISGGIEALG